MSNQSGPSSRARAKPTTGKMPKGPSLLERYRENTGRYLRSRKDVEAADLPALTALMVELIRMANDAPELCENLAKRHDIHISLGDVHRLLESHPSMFKMTRSEKYGTFFQLTNEASNSITFG